MRYPVVNMLGQAPRPARPVCPPVQDADPQLNCARTKEGGVLCSDGKYYPPGCPSPKVEEGAAAEYERQGGWLVPVTPPARSLTADVGGTFPYIPVAILVAGGVAAVIFA